MFVEPTKQLSLAEKTKLLMDDLLKWQDSIEAALQYSEGSHTFDDVVAKVIRGEVHFYTYPGCFLIMQVINYPQFKNYHCFLAGGSQEALDAVRDDMLSAAKAIGCRHLSISGRHGWVKRLQSQGRQWRHVFSTMYLDVPGDK